jgi:anti-sigma B factor antagonist
VSTAEAGDRLLHQYRLESGVAVVSVSGEVDVATCGLLRNRLLRVVTDENFRHLVVNLADVTFIDSTGIGVLVGVWRRVRASDGSLALPMPSSQVQKVLDATGLTKVLPVYGLEEDAVQACVRRSMPAD